MVDQLEQLIALSDPEDRPSLHIEALGPLIAKRGLRKQAAGVSGMGRDPEDAILVLAGRYAV